MKARFRTLLPCVVVFPQILIAQITTQVFTGQPTPGQQIFAPVNPPSSLAAPLAVQAPSIKNDAAFGCNKSTTPVPTTKPYFAACINALDGSLIQNCQLQVLLNVLQASGGHFHTDPGRDPGTLIAPDGTRSGTSFTANTGTAGFFQFQLESPDTAGQDIVTLLGTSSIGPVSPSLAEIDIQSSDPRTPLPAVGFKFQIDENSTGHAGANQWANQNGFLEFTLLPGNWALLEVGAGDSLDQVPDLIYTSIGLPFGGVFDVETVPGAGIKNPWHPPHCGHRNGNEADLRINTLDSDQRTDLAQAVSNTCIGLVALPGNNRFRPSNCLIFSFAQESPSTPSANHWHLRAQ